MVYYVDDIMRDIRVCLDQNMTSEALLTHLDADTLELDDIVRSKVLEAVRRAHMLAPAWLLEPGHNFGDAVYWDDQQSGHVLLPSDFMRLIMFEMSDWARPVYTAISPTDPAYPRMRQRVKALRGTAQKPVCVLVMRPEGRVLEFYSCTGEDAYVRRALYMPFPTIDSNGGVDIAERCYTPVIYIAAALVLINLGENDKAAALTQTAESLLQ